MANISFSTSANPSFRKCRHLDGKPDNANTEACCYDGPDIYGAPVKFSVEHNREFHVPVIVLHQRFIDICDLSAIADTKRCITTGLHGLTVAFIRIFVRATKATTMRSIELESVCRLTRKGGS